VTSMSAFFICPDDGFRNIVNNGFAMLARYKIPARYLCQRR
jgi:hypothetical protein